MKKIGGYLRRSSEGQKENESFDVQREEILKFLPSIFPDVDVEKDVIWYEDDAESGQFFDRPEVSRMIADAQAGVIDAVCYLHMDRFGREKYVLATLFYTFEEENDVRCLSVLGINPKNKDDFMGSGMRDIEMAFVVMESKRREFGLKTGRRNKNRRGVYANGGKLSWGYYQKPKENIRDKSDRLVLTDLVIKGHCKKIYEMIVIKNYSLEKTAKGLRNAGIKTAFGNDWCQQSLSYFLNKDNREPLCGHIITNRYYTKMIKSESGKKYTVTLKDKDGKPKEYPKKTWGHVYAKDPIYTYEEFDKIRQHIKTRSKQKVTDGKTTDNNYLLQGLDKRCGVCGARLRNCKGQNNKKGISPHYYVAEWRITSQAERERCKLKECHHLLNVRSEKVDAYVWDKLLWAILNQRSMVDKMLNQTDKESKIKSLNKKIEGEEKLLKKSNRGLEKLLDEYLELENRFSKKAIAKKEAKLKAEVEECERNIKKWQRELRKLEGALTLVKRFKGKREEMLSNMSKVEERLEGLSFEKRKEILQYLFHDTTFYFLPITKEEAIGQTPPDENYKDGHRWWFGKGKDVGVFLAWDGYISEDVLVNLLDYMKNLHTELYCEYRNELLHDEPYIC